MYKALHKTKHDPEMRWNRADRLFFADGACHILAYAFMEKYPSPDFKAVWIKPTPGFTGNHIFVTAADFVFDYHGYSERETYLNHTYRKAQRWWPGWQASLVELPRDVLVSESKSRSYDGLWLREPKQFLHDALPRARAFLSRFAPPPSIVRLLLLSAAAGAE